MTSTQEAILAHYEELGSWTAVARELRSNVGTVHAVAHGKRNPTLPLLKALGLHKPRVRVFAEAGTTERRERFYRVVRQQTGMEWCEVFDAIMDGRVTLETNNGLKG